MNNSVYLFAAFGITWSLIFFYVFRLFRSQKALDARISAIKETLRGKVESSKS